MNKRETTYVNIIEEQLAEKKIAEMFVDTDVSQQNDSQILFLQEQDGDCNTLNTNDNL
ncbi:hypothetical protein [Facilibium subflavum]|uniref:hypothetical protein n=1 Tax=Facilibium subflavum TaxID=2219058 RepID=UPI0013C2F710|nr:hypothetical protein [Facilibium subflavum]